MDKPPLLCVADLPDRLPLNPKLEFVRTVYGLDKGSISRGVVAQYALSMRTLEGSHF